MSNGVFNFNFLALVFSEILGGSEIYTRGPYAPWTPLSDNFFTQSEYFTISNCIAIVTIALSCTVCELLTLNIIVALTCGLKVTQGH